MAVWRAYDQESEPYLEALASGVNDTGLSRSEVHQRLIHLGNQAITSNIMEGYCRSFPAYTEQMKCYIEWELSLIHIFARLIGRNVSTVAREIRRNCSHMYDIPTYYPHTAQKKYLLRRSYCHRGMFHSQEVLDYIEEKLRATWSPERCV